MPDTHDSSDDWDELAREFALDKPEPARGEPDPAPADDEPAGAAGDAESDEDFEGGDEGAGGESTAEGEGPGGPGRKRRRRRRRRRKGGAVGEAPAPIGAADDEPDITDDAAEAEPVAVEDDAPAADPDEAEEIESTEFAPATAEEDTASEVLRELIANWNVPSWDSIVGGLYRPN